MLQEDGDDVIILNIENDSADQGYSG